MTDGMGVFEGDCFLLRWNMGIRSANRSLNTQILGSSKLFSLWSLRSLRFYLWFRALRSHLKQNGYALADFTFSDRGDRVGKAAGTGGGGYNGVMNSMGTVAVTRAPPRLLKVRLTL